MPERYDAIGGGYANVRRSDPRIAAQVRRALGDARSVVNVGAGTGSYEPDDIEVIAIEPSAEMRAQRPPGAAPAIAAHAEALPLADASVDAAMAILTLHHWSDRDAGLAELRRVARRRVVILTWDPGVGGTFWLNEYIPEIAHDDRILFEPIDDLAARLGATVEPVLVPRDCADGFAAAYWARPEAYLDPRTHAGISTFRLLGPERLAPRLERLRADLASGAWAERNAALAELDDFDAGYRLLIAERAQGVA